MTWCHSSVPPLRSDPWLLVGGREAQSAARGGGGGGDDDPDARKGVVTFDDWTDTLGAGSSSVGGGWPRGDTPKAVLRARRWVPPPFCHAC